MNATRRPSARGGHHGRCHCGHLLTHHMVVLPIPNTGNFRLEPSGPCELCRDGTCRHYTPTRD